MKVNLDTPVDEVQVQIIPLIDVVFCILTFFIVAVLQFQRPQGINLNLPQSKSSTVQPPERLIVTLAQTGQLYVGQQEVDRAQLETMLKTYHEKNPGGLLVLNAPQNAFYSDVIQVLDVLRSVGGDRVALATAPALPSPAPTVPTLPGTLPESTSPSLTSPNRLPGTPSNTTPGSLFDPNSLPGGSGLNPSGSGLGNPLPNAGQPTGTPITPTEAPTPTPAPSVSP